MKELQNNKYFDTLNELKQNPSHSQRSLASKLNISLGLTNAILKNLISRGWIKAKKDTGRKILYIITPQGMANVSRLLYNRFRETFHYYNYTKDLITDYLLKLYQQGEKEVNIYGTGQLAEITYYAGLGTPLKLNAIISDDANKKTFLGHQVLTLSDFIEKHSQNISDNSQQEFLIFSTSNPDQLEEEIKKYPNINAHLKIINIEDILKN
jgi:DNA-binding MarR family transcriptional regulator